MEAGAGTPSEAGHGAPKPPPRAAGVQSVERALDLLEAVAAGHAGVSQIARHAGLSPSTVHRLLATLVERGYVERSSDTHRYTLGHRALVLAGTAGTTEAQIRATARPLLRRIRKVTGETANLSVLDGTEAVFIEQEFQAGSGAGHLEREVRLPAHVSASGKAMLAFAAPERLKNLSASGFMRFTPRTIVDQQRLLRELDEVRARGFAVDDQERKSGYVCIAAPIFDRTGAVVAALSVGGWTTRIGEAAYGDLAELVGSSCAEISAQLGYRGPSRWPAGGGEDAAAAAG